MGFTQQLPAVFADRYLIERELGRGGMATVFLARDRRHDRDVAIKVLRPDLVSSSGAQRFVREIQIAARLVHPHIVSLHDSGIAEGLPYYVMPYVDGESLRVRMTREGRLPIDEALRITSEVADALHYAHAVGVVHRDIKPENILISAGHAVVADFGIAKAIKAGWDEGPSTGTVITSETDARIGTVAYMSPEQSVGDEALDIRSDQFSLAVVLYEMLTAALPFAADTAQAQIARRFVHDAPPLRAVRPDASSALERAVTRALARDPADRFATARDFARALTEDAAPPSATGASDTEPSVAVLPFVNLSGDPEDEFFSDGMTEEIINALMRLRRVRVVARTSVFALKGLNEDVRSVGRRLNVKSVLEGTVRRAQGKLHIAAKLINVADGFPVWFEEFNRESGDAVALQDEIAQTIVETLRPSLLASPAPTRSGPSEEAYKLYLRGRFFWNQRTPQSYARARQFLEQAIARDPDFALAYAGQADLSVSMTIQGFEPPAEAMSRARTAALRALALDPSLAEAHAALGAVLAVYDWEWRAATAQFQRAIAINEQYAMAYMWYANYVLIPQGRLDEAISELQRAERFDPLGTMIGMSIGMAHYFARRYDRAEPELRRVLDLVPNVIIAHFFLGRTLVESGRVEQGIRSLKRALKLSGGHPWAVAEIGYALARAGDRAGAIAALDALRAESARRYVSSGYPALVHAALGDVDAAVSAFERAREEHATDIIWLRMHPGLDALRSDPRIGALMRSIGLVS